jgi:hypothetical protein
MNELLKMMHHFRPILGHNHTAKNLSTPRQLPLMRERIKDCNQSSVQITWDWAELFFSSADNKPLVAW